MKMENVQLTKSVVSVKNVRLHLLFGNGVLDSIVYAEKV